MLNALHTGIELPSNLYYLRARYYDPYLNRWTQPDSIVPEAAQGVQAWDRYCFVSNNPLTYVDPTGKYGVQVHYYMTYNLVYSAVSKMGTARGWTDAQIKQVAGAMAETVGQANMSVDHEQVVHGADGKDRIEGGSNLGDKFMDNAPLLCESSPHKMKLWDAMNVVENAEDLTSFGEALHSLQDSFSHRSKLGLFNNMAFRVELGHNSEIDNYAFPVNVAPEFDIGLSDDAKIDYMMYYVTQYFIDQYVDELNWDLFEKYLLPEAEAEEKQD